jgi:hypothetical protein
MKSKSTSRNLQDSPEALLEPLYSDRQKYGAEKAKVKQHGKMK